MVQKMDDKQDKHYISWILEKVLWGNQLGYDMEWENQTKNESTSRYIELYKWENIP